MKTRCYLSVVLIAFLSTVAADESDMRTVVQLSSQHRAVVLAEMRQFLSGLQQITDALAREDMETVVRIAHSLGSPMTLNMPQDLKQVLPEEFRKLGFSVHASFDQIALDAGTLGDGKHTLSQLGETLSKCVACHSTYQIRADGSP